jgi:hypothetical protein
MMNGSGAHWAPFRFFRRDRADPLPAGLRLCSVGVVGCSDGGSRMKRGYCIPDSDPANWPFEEWTDKPVGLAAHDNKLVFR